METVVMENAYMTYDGQIRVDAHIIVVSLWNAYIKEAKDKENFISLNNKEFFENSFENSYDAAIAVAIGNWRWTDDFVYFDDEGYLVSFSRCDDETCPIDSDKIDIDYLIRALQDIGKGHKKEHKKEQEGCISRAVREALE